MPYTNAEKQARHRKLREEAIIQLEQIAQITVKEIMEEIKNEKKKQIQSKQTD